MGRLLKRHLAGFSAREETHDEVGGAHRQLGNIWPITNQTAGGGHILPFTDCGKASIRGQTSQSWRIVAEYRRGLNDNAFDAGGAHSIKDWSASLLAAKKATSKPKLAAVRRYSSA